jgi:hypothetical protein
MARTPEFEMVAEASKAVQYGLHDVAHKIALVIQREVWRKFILPNKQVVEHPTFADFVTANPPRGLGTDVDTIRKVCRGDSQYLDIIDRAIEEAQRPGTRSDLVDNINKVRRPDGTSAAKALRRLRKDRPDLHAAVLAGEKTPHGAMIEAGFRPKTVSLPLDVERAARLIRKHFDENDRQQLAKLIVEPVGDDPR